MNKSNVVVGLLVAAILVVAVAATGSRHMTSGDSSLASPAGAGEPAKLVVVVYTGHGFSPAVVKIARGGTIQFANQSGKALRIAPIKDPADATSASLGFVGSKSIGRGETFGVSVTQPGLFGYKNLHDPTSVGVVIVE